MHMYQTYIPTYATHTRSTGMYLHPRIEYIHTYAGLQVSVPLTKVDTEVAEPAACVGHFSNFEMQTQKRTSTLVYCITLP